MRTVYSHWHWVLLWAQEVNVYATWLDQNQHGWSNWEKKIEDETQQDDEEQNVNPEIAAAADDDGAADSHQSAEMSGGEEESSEMTNHNLLREMSLEGLGNFYHRSWNELQ